MITLIRSLSRSCCLIVIVLLFLFLTSTVWANVQGGHVTYGQAEIQQTSLDRVDILQSSHKAVIQWVSFDIGLNETVHFEQPSPQSLALNRILDSDPSTILGHLSATGQIFLINPNGILFGENAQVDVSSLLATTIDISDEDFANGHFDFSKTGRSDGYVINKGAITVREGGMVAMVAPWVRNEGVISARLGQVSLASAETFTLDMYGDGLVQIAVENEPAAPLIDETGQPVTSLVKNTGMISAEGGHVFLTTRSAGAFVDRAIDMSGIIEATSLVEQNGEIVLAGGDEGDVRVTGTLDTSASEVKAAGGIVKILGERIGLFQEAKVDVSGDKGGGQTFIGGAFQGGDELRSAEQTQVGPNAQIIADASQSGDGGQVVVWAEQTTSYYGNISAQGGEQSGNGGQVEVSGKENLNFIGSVDTAAPNGQVGELLLDPTDGVITSAGAAETADLTAVDEFADPDLGGDDDVKISADAINNAVANVSVKVTRDLTVEENIDMNNKGVNVSLTANRHVNITARVNTNEGDFTVQSDADNDGVGTTYFDMPYVLTHGGNATFIGPVELRRDTEITANGGNILFQNDITGDFQLQLRTPTHGNVTLQGNTDVGDFRLDGFNNFDSLGTLRAGDIFLYSGLGYIRVGFATAVAHRDTPAKDNGNIDISPSALMTLAGAFTAAGNLVATSINLANIAVNVAGDATINAISGTIAGIVLGVPTITGGATNTVNGGGGGNANIANVTDVENVLNQVDEANTETPEPQSEDRDNRNRTDDAGQADSTKPADPEIRVGDGRVVVYSADGTKIGEITSGGSGNDLIDAMFNAGYSSHQIHYVFTHAYLEGVECADVTVKPMSGYIEYEPNDGTSIRRYGPDGSTEELGLLDEIYVEDVFGIVDSVDMSDNDRLDNPVVKFEEDKDHGDIAVIYTADGIKIGWTNQDQSASELLNVLRMIGYTEEQLFQVFYKLEMYEYLDVEFDDILDIPEEGIDPTFTFIAGNQEAQDSDQEGSQETQVSSSNPESSTVASDEERYAPFNRTNTEESSLYELMVIDGVITDLPGEDMDENNTPGETAQTGSDKPVAPEVRVGDGRVVVYSADGAKLGEISLESSGKDLITAMLNAGYTTDQIVAVFCQGVEGGVACQDITYNYPNGISYQVGNALTTMSASGEMSLVGSTTNAEGFTSIVSTVIREDGKVESVSGAGRTVATTDGTLTRTVEDDQTRTTIRTDASGYREETIEYDVEGPSEGMRVVSGDDGVTTITTPDKPGVVNRIKEEGNTKTVTVLKDGVVVSTTVTEKRDDGSKVVTVTENDQKTVTFTSGDGKLQSRTVLDAAGKVSEISTRVSVDTSDKTSTTTERHTVVGGATTVTATNTTPNGKVTTQNVNYPDGRTIETSSHDGQGEMDINGHFLKERQVETRPGDDGDTVIIRERHEENTSFSNEVGATWFVIRETITTPSGSSTQSTVVRPGFDYPDWWVGRESLVAPSTIPQ